MTDSFKTCIFNLHHPLPNLIDVFLSKVEGSIQGTTAPHIDFQCLLVHLLPARQGKRDEGSTTWQRTCSKRLRSRKCSAAVAHVHRGPWGRIESSHQAEDISAVGFLAFQKTGIPLGQNASMSQQDHLSIARHDHLLQRATSMQAKTGDLVLVCMAGTSPGRLGCPQNHSKNSKYLILMLILQKA